MPRILVVDDEPDICALIRRYAEHDGYAEFLSKLASGAEGTIEYSTDTRYVYGAYIELENAETAVLYTSVMLGAVGATASIIRTQLLWVTVLSLVIAFMLAAEPGIYGCVLRLKKPLICACIGSAAGSLVAISLLTDSGAELLMHVGLDTISLGGKYFEAKVKDGDQVKRGDLLLEFDLDAISKDFKTFTPVLITNADDFAAMEMKHTAGKVSVGEALYEAKA